MDNQEDQRNQDGPTSEDYLMAAIMDEILSCNGVDQALDVANWINGLLQNSFINGYTSGTDDFAQKINEVIDNG